jgi:very-short-patch-repair endonuclease
MGRKSHSFDREIAKLAERQHGIVALWQLLVLGLSRDAVRCRVDLGRLHRLYRGVYAVGHRKISWHGRVMAAVLLHGPDAVASHRTAAALWDLLPPRGNDVHVTVAAAGRAKRKGIVLHQVRELHPKDRTTKDGIPVTALGRTLIDVFSSESEERTERALEQAERIGLFDGKAIDGACDRSPTRRGVKRIRVRLRKHRAPAESDSTLERRFLIFCRHYRLPTPKMNRWIEDYKLDAVWPERKLVVELDDYYTHRTRKSFESDRRRDARLQSLGYRVIRITRERLEMEPGVVAEELRLLLSRP